MVTPASRAISSRCGRAGSRLHNKRYFRADFVALRRIFGNEDAKKFRQALLAVEKINRRWGKDTVRFAVANPEGR